MNNRKDQILILLYTYRFLTRNQIQTLLHHKQFNRVIVWLNQLTESGYIRRYYNPQTVTIPALYSLGLKGRKYLKDNAAFKDINHSLLDRVWREHVLSKQFREQCLFMADVYISLLTLLEKTGARLHFYPKTKLHGMKYLILPYPDAYFSIEEKNGSVKRYFLELINELPARMVLRKRVKQYLNYFDNGYWQQYSKKSFPYIIFVCPDDRSKNYLDRYIQTQLEDYEDLHFYLTTQEKVKQSGLTREVLQEVLPH